MELVYPQKVFIMSNGSISLERLCKPTRYECIVMPNIENRLVQQGLLRVKIGTAIPHIQLAIVREYCFRGVVAWSRPFVAVLMVCLVKLDNGASGYELSLALRCHRLSVRVVRTCLEVPVGMKKDTCRV